MRGNETRTASRDKYFYSPIETKHMSQQLISIPDSCTALGNVSRTTLYELVNAGELTKVNIGRRGFITAKSIAAYVDRLSQPTSA